PHPERSDDADSGTDYDYGQLDSQGLQFVLQNTPTSTDSDSHSPPVFDSDLNLDNAADGATGNNNNQQQRVASEHVLAAGVTQQLGRFRDRNFSCGQQAKQLLLAGLGKRLASRPRPQSLRETKS